MNLGLNKDDETDDEDNSIAVVDSVYGERTVERERTSWRSVVRFRGPCTMSKESPGERTKELSTYSA
jgi:hypothetical protein